jgi:uncharacterized iron-regulated membrane protein
MIVTGRRRSIPERRRIIRPILIQYMRFLQFNRVVHRWATVAVTIPLLIVIGTGILLMLKKEFSWIQPPSQRGGAVELTLPFEQILDISKSVPEAEIQSWEDIDRLDVRPSKGMLKVRAQNRWEIQLDAETGKILQVAYRRSDLIESLHDGSFFHDRVKTWVFLPSAFILAIMLLTGIYIFVIYLIIPFQWRTLRKKKI